MPTLIDVLFGNLPKKVPTQPPSDTGELLAQSIDWTPLKRGGSRRVSHRIAPLGEDRVRITLGSAAYGVFLLAPAIAILMLLVGLKIVLNSVRSVPLDLTALEMILLFAAPIVVIIVSFVQLRSLLPIYIDRRKKLLWQGIGTPEIDARNTQFRTVYDLSLISAIQILCEQVAEEVNEDSLISWSRYYTSYEVNLVFANGERLNLFDHGDWDEIDRSARLLAEFLEVPIWDNTEEFRNPDTGHGQVEAEVNRARTAS